MTKMYIENKEVTWNVHDITVYGTITAPKGQTAHSAVIFIAGSGPTDRDWCSPILPGTNGSAKLLAEVLAEQGFMTLRYDKLGSGPRVMENLPKFIGKISMQHYVDELTGAVETILSEKNFDGGNIFVLANSEGTIHAVNYQLQAKSNRFKGLVLTGAPAVSVGDLARTQVSQQYESLPGGDIIMKLYDAAMAEFLAKKPITVDPSLPDTVKTILLSLNTPANLPFGRELWAYRLADYISKVGEPILVVIGKKDLQVDWEVNGKALEGATAGNSGASFVYPENANHVLKHEATPKEQLTGQTAIMNYNIENAVLDEEAVNAIIGWLQKF